MVQRMSAPQAISAMSLSKEVGVSQSQLSRWLRAAPNLVPMKRERPSEHVVQSGSSRTAAEKLRIVMAAAALAPGELGAFLRREGVHAYSARTRAPVPEPPGHRFREDLGARSDALGHRFR